MKNFPHQMNDLFRLTRGLQVFADLEQQGEDINDDQVVGIALARAGVYTFREKDQTLDELLETELQKPRSNRGTHTAARDLRRIFLLAGFLEQDTDGMLGISQSGHNLLGVETDRKAELPFLWGRALRKMSLCDTGGNASHPYRILLRLVDARPGILKRYLALALEARDDSDEEFGRLLELIDRQDWNTTLRAIGASEYSAKNAVKILPAIAEQIGDIVREGESCYPGSLSAELGQLTVGEVLEPPPPDHHWLPSRRHRAVTSQEIAPLGSTGEVELRGRERDLAAFEEGIEQRRERTNRHQRLVQDFAHLCDSAGLRLYEDPFDCLAVGTQGRSVLAEAKTLSGELADERNQVQRALAQLNYYQFFDLPVEVVAHHQIIRIAVFESEISLEHQRFLEHHQVGAIWQVDDGFFGTDDALAILRDLGIL
jgi:hypothetical protein